MEFTKDACRVKISELTDEITSQETAADPEIILHTDIYEDKEKSRMDRIKNKKLSKAEERIFREIKVKGDGNCFFRCLSFHIFGNESRHGDIRKEIVTFMTANSEDFSPYVDGSIQEHLRNMSFADGRRESWATEAEVMAASALYEVNVKVKVKYRGSRFVWHTYTFRVNSNTANVVRSSQIPYTKSMHVVYRSNHYNFLLHESLDLGVPRPSEMPTITNDMHGTNIDWFDMGHMPHRRDGSGTAEKGKSVDNTADSFRLDTGTAEKGKSVDNTADSFRLDTGTREKGKSVDNTADSFRLDTGTAEKGKSVDNTADSFHLDAGEPVVGTTKTNDYPASGHSAAADITGPNRSTGKTCRKRQQGKKQEHLSENRKLVESTDTRDKTQNCSNDKGQKNKNRKATNDIKELVTNLSSYTPTDSEISLLEKGLKFIPDRSKINTTK